MTVQVDIAVSCPGCDAWCFELCLCADKRRAVEILLRDEEWSKKSDRWIAEKCGVSNRFVSNLRSETVNGSQLREGLDGKVRELPKRRISPPAVELIRIQHGAGPKEAMSGSNPERLGASS